MGDYSIKDINRSKVLAFILIMPAFFDVLNVLMKTFGLDIASIITAATYIMVLMYIIIACGISAIDLMVLITIYTILGLNYIFFPDSREYMSSQGMMIIYLFFIPYCAISIRKICDWNTVFQYLYKLSSVAIISCVIMLLFFPYDQYLVYMDFSYSLLPAICSCYYQFAKTRHKEEKHKRIIPLCLFIIGLVSIFAFGARACILYAIMFVLILELLRDDSSIRKKVFISLVAIIMSSFVMFFMDSLLNYLSSVAFFKSSYLIRSFARGKLFTSDTRDIIWESCIVRIQTMGLSVGGFFGDRKYCFAVYPHNIALELLMSWGWIIGTSLLLLLLGLIIKSIKIGGNERIICIFVLCACLSRYIFSGSYIIEGRFWVSLFTLIAITRRYSPIRVS